MPMPMCRTLTTRTGIDTGVGSATLSARDPTRAYSVLVLCLSRRSP